MRTDVRIWLFLNKGMNTNLLGPGRRLKGELVFYTGVGSANTSSTLFPRQAGESVPLEEKCCPGSFMHLSLWLIPYSRDSQYLFPSSCLPVEALVVAGQKAAQKKDHVSSPLFQLGGAMQLSSGQ